MVTARDSYNTGRLTARPDNQSGKGTFTAGLQPLFLDGKRDGLLYISENYQPNRPAAMAVLLHGAGGQAEHGLSLLSKYADDFNIILLAPASRAATWHIIVNNAFGKDVLFLDQALT